MNIIRQDIDQLNVVLKIQIDKADYSEKVENGLVNYRRKANIPGFRPGKTPMPLIKKMAGKAIMVDEINKLVTETLEKTLREQNLSVFGEPIPSKDHQKPVDFDKDESFEFCFDLGLNPVFEVKFNPEDAITYYRLKVEDSHIDSTVESHTRRYGTSAESETISENDLLRGQIAETDEQGNIISENYQPGPCMISVNNIKDEAVKKSFTDARKGDKICFDIETAFERNEAAYMLGVKDPDKPVTGHFCFTIESATSFTPAEVNQELFNKVYGEGTISSVEEYRNRIKEEIAKTFEKETDFKFYIDVKKHLMEKLDISLPDEFLKRWLKIANKEIDDATLEKEYPAFREDLIWQLIRDKITGENQITATEEEILGFARAATMSQFANYGIYNLSDDHITSFANDILKKPEEKKKIKSKIIEDKVIAFFKNNVTIAEKEVSIEEFGKIING